MGVRIGRRVFDDGCTIVDKSLVTIGDDCVLNAGSVVQPHSQEDSAFKSDRITIGSGCTLGVGSHVHYGVTLGDGASLGPHSFLMKGEEVPPNAHWSMNPATEPRAPVPGSRQAEADRSPEPAEAFGRIPRWTLQPVPGVAERREAVPDELTAALRRLADELAVPLSTVVHAAHGRVLAALTGDRDVTTGYVGAEGGEPLPCRLETEVDSWRALVRARVGPSRRWPITTEGSFESVFDPAGRQADPTNGAVLRLGVSERRRDLSLRLAYRTDVLDEGCRSEDLRLPPDRPATARRRPGRRSGASEPALRGGAPPPVRRVRRAAPGAP